MAAELSVVESLAVIETTEDLEPSEQVEVPAESVEPPVELAEGVEQSAELPEPVVEQAIDQLPVPTSETATDLQSTPILDLVAEELLSAADLPLALVQSEAAAEDLTLRAEQAQVAEPEPPAAEIDPLGETFDPHAHEALLQQPSDAPEGSVIQVLQKGFRLGDHVLRPARVIVAAPAE